MLYWLGLGSILYILWPIENINSTIVGYNHHLIIYPIWADIPCGNFGVALLRNHNCTGYGCQHRKNLNPIRVMFIRILPPHHKNIKPIYHRYYGGIRVYRFYGGFLLSKIFAINITNMGCEKNISRLPTLHPYILPPPTYPTDIPKKSKS